MKNIQKTSSEDILRKQLIRILYSFAEEVKVKEEPLSNGKLQQWLCEDQFEQVVHEILKRVDDAIKI
jgi:hypothetical protein